MAGQMAAAHRGADEEAAQAHHPVQMGAALRIAPPYPRIARVKAQRRGRESDRAQPAMGRADEVADLAADEGGGALRMLGGEQGVPDPPLRLVLDHHQPQAFNIAHLGRHVDRGGHGRIEASGRRPMTMGAGCGQRNLLLRVQHLERFQAPGELCAPAGIDEAELRADLAPKRGTALPRTLCHNGLEARSGLGRTQRLENLALEAHAVGLHTSGRSLSSTRCGDRAALALALKGPITRGPRGGIRRSFATTPLRFANPCSAKKPGGMRHPSPVCERGSESAPCDSVIPTTTIQGNPRRGKSRHRTRRSLHRYRTCSRTSRLRRWASTRLR